MNPDEARYVSRSHEEEMADLVERRNRFWRQEFERIMSEDELSSREDDPTPRARRDAQETRGRATSALRRTAGHDEAAE